MADRHVRAERHRVRQPSRWTRDLRLQGSADITVAGLRISTAGASVELGASPIQSGISPRAGDRAGEPHHRRTGRPSVLADRPHRTGAGHELLLHERRPTPTSTTTDSLVLVSIDYFDEGNGQFGLHYDSPGETIPEKFKNSEVDHLRRHQDLEDPHLRAHRRRDDEPLERIRLPDPHRRRRGRPQGRRRPRRQGRDGARRHRRPDRPDRRGRPGPEGRTRRHPRRPVPGRQPSDLPRRPSTTRARSRRRRA